MKRIIVIPARMGSTRIPNKILTPIAGIPMIKRVYEQCKKADVDRVAVVTDCLHLSFFHPDFSSPEDVIGIPDADIFYNLSPTIKNGTERVAKTLTNILGERGDQSPHISVMNVQADQPLIPPELINDTFKFYEHNRTSANLFDFATTATLCPHEYIMERQRTVSVVFDDKSRRAIFFSRHLLKKREGPFYCKHLGIYVGHPLAFYWYASTTSKFEDIESLEQMRVLENGGVMRVHVSLMDSPAVDTCEDIYAVEGRIYHAGYN